MYRVSIMLSTLARLGLVFVCPFHKMGRGLPAFPFESYQLEVQVIEKERKKKKRKATQQIDKISLIYISTRDTYQDSLSEKSVLSESIRSGKQRKIRHHSVDP